MSRSILSPSMRAVVLAGCAIVLAACSGGSSTASTDAVTTTVTVAESTTVTPTTAAETTTTERATTTTVRQTTTTEAPSGVTAVVWASAVDPARVTQQEPPPEASADGVTVRLMLAISVPKEASQECADEIGFEDPALTHCMIIQLSMDVAADFPVDQSSEDATVFLDALITPDGAQYGSIFSESGYPGTVDTTLLVLVAGGTPGSTLKVQTGSNLVGYTTHTFVLPAAEAFLPAPWVDT